MGTAYNDVAHLLRRAGFGASPDEISAYAQLDLPVLVDRLLNPSAVPAVVWPSVVADTTANDYNRWVTHLQWWSDRMASTPAPLLEKMVLFWHMHFTSSQDKSGFQAMWKQFDLFRSLGLGSFQTLTQAVALSPAMLDYLDNSSNVKGRPNENWARESLELFTLGLNQYTQADVVNVAKAWTGHRITNGAYAFDAARHDTTNKTIFGITKNWDGPDVITEICSGTKRATTARFIANKLWEFFAYPSPSSALLDVLTNAFVASNLDIKALLRVIFLRSEFYSATAKERRVRNPMEYIVAAAKSTGISSADATHPEWYCEAIGMRPFYPPNVSGWKGNEAWINMSTSWAKGRFARNLTWTAANRGVLSGTSTLSVATAVQRTFDTFGINEPSASTRNALEKAVTDERTVRGWAEAQNLITLAMLTPEFQLA